jgi:hypothetical protein
MLDVINVNGRYYVSVDDFINHLTIAAESVIAFTGEAAPGGSRYVSDTLYATIETLQNLKKHDE